MTTKERLHMLVDRLDEGQATSMVEFLDEIFDPERDTPRQLPSWISDIERSQYGMDESEEISSSHHESLLGWRHNFSQD